MLRFCTALLLVVYFAVMILVAVLFIWDVPKGTREFVGVAVILFGVVLGLLRNPNKDLPLVSDTSLEGTSLVLTGAGAALTLAGSVLEADATERAACGWVLIGALLLGMVWEGLGAVRQRRHKAV